MICKKSDSSISSIAKCLRDGGVAILPTDTVYGFSGCVDLSGGRILKSDEKIFKIKGRPESKPLIQLISSPEEIKKFTDMEIDENLLKKWPGPLTIIVPIKKESPFAFDIQTVAFRCPGDPWLRSIIEECGTPIYSTSVNRSGKAVLDEENRILEEFSNEVDIIVLDGDKKGAVPSTIVSIIEGETKILRQGSVII